MDFPATTAQADSLFLHQGNHRKTIVIALDVQDEEIVKRAAGRLICRQCGAIYNRDNAPPVNSNICNLCGGEVVRRSDDEEQVVRERLKIYHEVTQPLINYYREHKLLKIVDGTSPQDIVYNQLAYLIEKEAIA